LIESAGVIVTILARAPEFIEHLVDKWLASLGRQSRISHHPHRPSKAQVNHSCSGDAPEGYL
jgi:hypothetical protein